MSQIPNRKCIFMGIGEMLWSGVMSHFGPNDKNKHIYSKGFQEETEDRMIQRVLIALRATSHEVFRRSPFIKIRDI